MIFTVTESAFRAAIHGNGSLTVALIALCHLASEDPHAIEPELNVDPRDASSVCAQWLRQLPGKIQLALRANLMEGAQRATRASSRKARARVAPEQSNPRGYPPVLSIEDACVVAALPLSIWLEDSRSDRAFVLRAADRRRSHIERWERDRALQFQHGGGSTLARQVEALSPLGALRAFVLSDSDRESATAKPPEKVDLLRETCAERGVPLHILKRREIENYLPPEAIEWWRANSTDYNSTFREWVSTAYTDAGEARWYVDMKSVLGGRCWSIFDDAEGWRWQWLVADGSAEELRELVSLLEERL
jgi:hypothetical protein